MSRKGDVCLSRPPTNTDTDTNTDMMERTRGKNIEESKKDGGIFRKVL